MEKFSDLLISMAALEARIDAIHRSWADCDSVYSIGMVKGPQMSLNRCLICPVEAPRPKRMVLIHKMRACPAWPDVMVHRDRRHEDNPLNTRPASILQQQNLTHEIAAEMGLKVAPI